MATSHKHDLINKAGGEYVPPALNKNDSLDPNDDGNDNLSNEGNINPKEPLIWCMMEVMMKLLIKIHLKIIQVQI